MKRSVAAAGIISVIAGATALAGDQFAFDGMGAMMLEHEAGETFDEVAEQHVGAGHCEEQKRMAKAQALEMQKAYAQTFAQMSSRLGKLEIQTLPETARLSAQQLKSLKVERIVAVEAAQQSLAQHRAVFERHRLALRDKELRAQVEDALAAAERALASK